MYRKNKMEKGQKMLIMAAAIAAGVLLGAPAAEAASDVEINNKNFPDQALQEAVKVFDTNADGKLQSDEIAKVETLKLRKFVDADDVSGDETMPKYQKSDFKFDFGGIQYLTNLKDLSINLSGGVAEDGKHYDSVISNFKQAYRLKKLKSLEFYGAKQKTVDLSKWTKLETADLSISGLSKFKVSNKALQKIRLGKSTSGVKSLDFRNAPKLKTLYLDDLRSTNVYFGKKNKKLRGLYITSNGKKKIKSMSVKPLKGLKRLTMAQVNISKMDFSGNKALEDIYVDDCSMKTLDLSKSTKLTSVACEGKKTKKVVVPKKNVISTFKWVNAKLSKFSSSRLNPKTLTSVILFGNRIDTLNLKRFTKLDYIAVDKDVKVQLAASVSEDKISRD